MSGNKRKGREGVPPPVPKKQNKKESAHATAPAAPMAEDKFNVESKTEESGSIDDHPLQKGHYLIVKYRDGSNRLAKIIESTSGSSPRSTQYYIHYSDFNRRMDEWIAAPRIVAYPSEANIIGANREAQENLAKKLKSSDSKGSLTDLEHKPSEEIKSVSSTPVPHSVPAVRSTGGNIQRSGHRSRSNSMVALQPSMVISTVADMDHDEHEGMDEESLLEHEEVTKVKNIKYVKLGKYIMECWYFSPFPPEYYPNGFAECLYFCEFSFRFFSTKEELIRYQKKPNLARHPPGNEIYRDNEVSMFELDGAVEKVYCQNLCYFAKLFLDHKTLYWDVDPFLFYVLCTRDERGFHPVGYFSKEKYSDMGFNLACILTFPCMQRHGYGRFLMAFSYELSKKEEKAGSPEKPLSDLGAVGYKSYWAHTILKVLRDYPGQIISIMDITRITSILPDDVHATLQMLNLLHYQNSSGICSASGGSGGLGSSTSNTSTDGIALSTEGDSSEQCVLYAPVDVIDSLLLKYPEGQLPVQPEKLHWAPLYVTDPKKDKWSIKSLRDVKDSIIISSSSSSKVDTAAETLMI